MRKLMDSLKIEKPREMRNKQKKELVYENGTQLIRLSIGRKHRAW